MGRNWRRKSGKGGGKGKGGGGKGSGGKGGGGKGGKTDQWVSLFTNCIIQKTSQHIKIANVRSECIGRDLGLGFDRLADTHWDFILNDLQPILD